jgi:hypothetical protein
VAISLIQFVEFVYQGVEGVDGRFMGRGGRGCRRGYFGSGDPGVGDIKWEYDCTCGTNAGAGRTAILAGIGLGDEDVAAGIEVVDAEKTEVVALLAVNAGGMVNDRVPTGRRELVDDADMRRIYGRDTLHQGICGGVGGGEIGEIEAGNGGGRGGNSEVVQSPKGGTRVQP